MSFGPAISRIVPASVLSLTLVSCSGSSSGSTVLTAEMPLHRRERRHRGAVGGADADRRPQQRKARWRTGGTQNRP